MNRFAPTFAFIACALALGAFLPAPEAQAASSEALRQTGLRVLGASRGYATAALWLRAGDAYKRGDFFEAEAMYSLIREIQPRNPAVFSFLSWNESYNIPSNFDDNARRLLWLERGLATIHEGQRALPRDAGLRMEEWHFIFNRTKGSPFDVLRMELKYWREREPKWALIVVDLLEQRRKLSDAKRRQLDGFSEAANLPVDLVPLASAFSELSPADQAKLLDENFDEKKEAALDTDFDVVARQQLRAFMPLDEEVKAILVLANWARLHLMAQAARPAIEMLPRGLSTDGAVMNSYKYAQQNLLPDLEQVFTPLYKAGVRAAYKSGLELARRAYGEEGAKEFAQHQRENFGSLPGWIE
jgi:hypothetical protein